MLMLWSRSDGCKYTDSYAVKTSLPQHIKLDTHLGWQHSRIWRRPVDRSGKDERPYIFFPRRTTTINKSPVFQKADLPLIIAFWMRFAKNSRLCECTVHNLGNDVKQLRRFREEDVFGKVLQPTTALAEESKNSRGASGDKRDTN